MPSASNEKHYICFCKEICLPLRSDISQSSQGTSYPGIRKYSPLWLPPILVISKPFSLYLPSMLPFGWLNYLACTTFFQTGSSSGPLYLASLSFLTAPTTPWFLSMRLLGISHFSDLICSPLVAYLHSQTLTIAINRNCSYYKLVDTEMSPAGYTFPFHIPSIVIIPSREISSISSTLSVSFLWLESSLSE